MNNVEDKKEEDAPHELFLTTRQKKELVVPLKYISNFFRLFEMPLINCKIHLELEWDPNCLLCSDDATAGNNVTFQITDTKLYVPVVILSTKYTTHLTKVIERRVSTISILE